jgi:tetratricopeptide (TPR) repeat protein
MAAAIFEALIYVSPNDSEAHNNYGFCILPTNPAAALESFEQAAQIRKSGDLTTLANQVLALHLLGRHADALALGSSDLATNLPSLRGWMWLLGDSHELRLSDLIDIRAYLEELLMHIESCPEVHRA